MGKSNLALQCLRKGCFLFFKTFPRIVIMTSTCFLDVRTGWIIKLMR